MRSLTCALPSKDVFSLNCLLSLDFCDLSHCPDPEERHLETLWEFQAVKTSLVL